MSPQQTRGRGRRRSPGPPLTLAEFTTFLRESWRQLTTGQRLTYPFWFTLARFSNSPAAWQELGRTVLGGVAAALRNPLPAAAGLASGLAQGGRLLLGGLFSAGTGLARTSGHALGRARENPALAITLLLPLLLLGGFLVGQAIVAGLSGEAACVLIGAGVGGGLGVLVALWREETGAGSLAAHLILGLAAGSFFGVLAGVLF
jgi:hypothetical protein